MWAPWSLRLPVVGCLVYNPICFLPFFSISGEIGSVLEASFTLPGGITSHNKKSKHAGNNGGGGGGGAAAVDRGGAGGGREGGRRKEMKTVTRAGRGDS